MALSSARHAMLRIRSIAVRGPRLTALKPIHQLQRQPRYWIGRRFSTAQGEGSSGGQQSSSNDQSKGKEKEKEKEEKKRRKPGEILADWMKTVGGVVGLLGGSLALRDKLDAATRDAREIEAIRQLIAQSFELSARGVASVAHALRVEALAKLQPLVQRMIPTNPEYLGLIRDVAHVTYNMATYLQTRSSGQPMTTPYDSKSWAAFDANNLLQLSHTYTLLANHHSRAESDAISSRLAVSVAELERAERGMLSSITRHMGDNSPHNPKVALRDRIDLYQTAVEFADDNPVLAVRALNNWGVASFVWANHREAVKQYERALAVLRKLDDTLRDKTTEQQLTLLEFHVSDLLHCRDVADVKRVRRLDAGHFLAKLGQWKSTMSMNLMLVYGHHTTTQSELDLSKMMTYLALIPTTRFGFVQPRKSRSDLLPKRRGLSAAGSSDPTASAPNTTAGEGGAVPSVTQPPVPSLPPPSAESAAAAIASTSIVIDDRDSEDDEAARTDRELNGIVRSNLLYVLSTAARACLNGDARLDTALKPQDVVTAATAINARVTDANPRAISARLWYAELLLMTAGTAARMPAAAAPTPSTTPPTSASPLPSSALVTPPGLVSPAVSSACLHRAREMLPVLARTVAADAPQNKEYAARLQSLQALLVVLSPEKISAEAGVSDKWTRATTELKEALNAYTAVQKSGRTAPEAAAINDQLKEMITNKSDLMRARPLKDKHFIFTADHMKLVADRVNVQIVPVPF